MNNLFKTDSFCPYRILIIMMVMACSLAACKRSQINHLNIAEQVFPNEIGHEWFYEISQGTLGVDTVHVQIVGEEKLPNGSTAKVWVYAYSAMNDTNFVIANNDTVHIYDKSIKFYGSLSGIQPIMSYYFPLQVGQKSVTNGNNIQVCMASDIDVPAGKFLDCKLITNQFSSVNAWRHDSIYFKENIGMISKKQAAFDLLPLPGNGSWKLINYKLTRK